MKKYLVVLLVACGDEVHRLPDAPNTAIGAALDGLRWQIPCGAHVTATGCAADAPAPQTATLAGAAGTTYQVELHFRGVVELKNYDGGTNDGTFNAGGTENTDGYNLYKLAVSSPATNYYLNAGEELQRSVALDFTHTISINGGATVTLTADPQDGAEVQNVDTAGTPIVVSDIAPAPAAYDGQFIQIDVISVD